MVNKDSYKISVIIPIYNVEQYLSKCLDSLLNQTYRNLEILLINDGSTDDSLKICEYFSSLDNRITIVSKPNGGQSSARNVGIEMASGDYVSFIDSDDWLDLHMYEYLIKYLINNNADVSVCQAYYCKGDKIKAECNNGDVHILKGYHEIMGHILPYQQPFLKFQAWNKLYKATLVKKVRFKEGQVYEEIDFERNVFKGAQKVVCFNIPLYYYRVGRPGSTISSFDKKRLVKFTDLDLCIEEFIGVEEFNYASKFIKYSMNSCLEFSFLAYKFELEAEIQDFLYRKFSDYMTQQNSYRGHITWRQRLFKFSPRLHYYLMLLYFEIIYKCR